VFCDNILNKKKKMGASESKKANIINENINVPVNSVNEPSRNIDIIKICVISLVVTLITLAIFYKLKKQVQKFSVTRKSVEKKIINAEVALLTV
jgi:hypothetical protein